MIREPPFEAGGINLTIAEVSPAVAVTWRGALGCVSLAIADAGVAGATKIRKIIERIRMRLVPKTFLRAYFIVSVRLPHSQTMTAAVQVGPSEMEAMHQQVKLDYAKRMHLRTTRRVHRYRKPNTRSQWMQSRKFPQLVSPSYEASRTPGQELLQQQG